MKDFESFLHTRGLSYTEPRKALFKLLVAADRPMEIEDIKSQLPAVDRATVYRMIDTFEEHGIIKRVWFGDEIMVELGEEFEKQHHHLVCTECGRVEKIRFRSTERQLHRRARKYGFTPTDHILEVFGLCPDCATPSN